MQQQENDVCYAPNIGAGCYKKERKKEEKKKRKRKSNCSKEND
jgi:hypothetical protein